MLKKGIALLLAVVSLLLCACGSEQQNMPTQTLAVETTEPVTQPTEPAPRQPTVGICLPSGSAQWKQQGQLLSQQLEDIGYNTVVEYAAGDPKVQQNQMLELIEKQVDCIVVTAVDGYGLTDGLNRAKSAGIPVVAYDRLLMYTDATAFCVQPDIYTIGQQLAQYIVKKQEPTPKKPKTIEFFMGDPDNENSLQFYRGVMDVLQPLLQSRALVCRSKRTAFEDICLPSESVQAALEQCYEYMQEYYEKSRPDILCCATDILAEGCVYALENFQNRIGKNYPMIASAGGSVGAVARISAGTQSVSMYIDSNALAEQCVKLIHQMLSEKPMPETEKRNNGTTDVLCYSQSTAAVDGENYHLLLDVGVYTQTQLQEALLEENRPDVSIPVATRPNTVPTVPTKAPTTESTETVPADTMPIETTAPTETTQNQTDPAETVPTQTAPTETTPTKPAPAETVAPTTAPVISIAEP